MACAEFCKMKFHAANALHRMPMKRLHTKRS
jgi:hypothetical protein